MLLKLIGFYSTASFFQDTDFFVDTHSYVLRFYVTGLDFSPSVILHSTCLTSEMLRDNNGFAKLHDGKNDKEYSFLIPLLFILQINNFPV